MKRIVNEAESKGRETKRNVAEFLWTNHLWMIFILILWIMYSIYCYIHYDDACLVYHTTNPAVFIPIIYCPLYALYLFLDSENK